MLSKKDDTGKGAGIKVSLETVTRIVQMHSNGLHPEHCKPELVAQKVVDGTYPGITARELDTLAAETAASMTTKHPDYAKLAARIAVSSPHKDTDSSFTRTITVLFEHVDARSGLKAPLIAKDVYQTVVKHKARLDRAIVHARDFDYDYFGFKTLERNYLLKANGRIVERPQHMLMRVAVGIHKADIEAALTTYQLISEGFYIHASPALFNAGTPRPQLSSCFLVCMKEDSIGGIYDTLKECASISQTAGGVGLSVHSVRAAGSYIRGTNGTSNGIVPMLRVFNDLARFVDQGGGRRKGAFAIYLEPWHADIFEWLALRRNHGKEERRARDLYYGLWVNDLFMARVEADQKWSLFCPREARGLTDVWGAEFEALYVKYENEGKARRIVDARKLWFAILEAQIETGNPYMLYKDACNRKSNQRNLGTIKCSNLCSEIILYSSPNETAVCNLASVALPRFVRERGVPYDCHVSGPRLVGSLGSEDRCFDFDKLVEVTAQAVRSMNRVIDVQAYPTEAAARSNRRHRPVGVGVQGLADVFILLGMPFDSPRARALNREIFECIYFAALTASCQLAREEGPYETYAGTPMSEGVIQPDMWGASLSDRWDWPGLRAGVARYGVRNSVLCAPMPTASTSQILGNNECFEPYTSNIYARRVISGEFTVVNRHLLADLVTAGLWTPALKNELLHYNGSVQRISGIPDDWKQIYKTVWEIKQRTIVDMAADRGAFVDQSQSLNIHMENVSFAKLTSLHFYAWKKGLKTGLYYLRTRAAADAIQFTVDKSTIPGRPRKQVPVSSAAVSDSGQATEAEPSTGAEPLTDARERADEPCRGSQSFSDQRADLPVALEPECGSSLPAQPESACLPAEPLTDAVCGSPTSVIGGMCDDKFHQQLSALSSRFELVQPFR